MALSKIVDTYIAPVSLTIATIRTDGVAKFAEPAQYLLHKLAIRHERAPIGTVNYNGVVECALGLLRDKTVALLTCMTEVETSQLGRIGYATPATCPTDVSPAPSNRALHCTKSV